MKRLLFIPFVLIATWSIAAQQNLNYSTRTTWSTEAAKVQSNFTELYSGKADASCFSSESAFNACFDLTWASGGADNLGTSTSSDVIALWASGSCSGYLKSDGTCDTPSGTISTVTTVGATGSDSYVPTEQAVRELFDSIPAITWDASLTNSTNTISVTNPVTAEAFSGSGWNGDTQGLTRNDAYDYLHIGDPDDNGIPNKKEVSTASKSTTYTIGTDSTAEAYGGTIYVTSATTITAPAVTAGMSFTVVTIGNIAVSLDVNASDRMILDGTALSDGDKATNTSTSGDTIYCQYESANGWFCWSGTMHATTRHWSDGN